MISAEKFWFGQVGLKHDKAFMRLILDGSFEDFKYWRKQGRKTECILMNRHFETVWEASQLFRRKYGLPMKKQLESWMTEWIKVTMTEQAKELFAAWDIHDADIFTGLDALAAQGYKITLTFQQDSKTYQASVICTDKESPNKGMGVSAFAPDGYTAYRVALFKVDQILPARWSDYITELGDVIG